MNMLDSSDIELTCPHCSGKLKERIGKLKTNPTLTCRHCRGTIQISADQLRAAVQKIDKAMADMKRALGRIGK